MRNDSALSDLALESHLKPALADVFSREIQGRPITILRVSGKTRIWPTPGTSMPSREYGPSVRSRCRLPSRKATRQERRTLNQEGVSPCFAKLGQQMHGIEVDHAVWIA